MAQKAFFGQDGVISSEFISNVVFNGAGHNIVVGSTKGYVDEFRRRWRHFQSNLEIMKLHPAAERVRKQREGAVQLRRCVCGTLT